MTLQKKNINLASTQQKDQQQPISLYKKLTANSNEYYVNPQNTLISSRYSKLSTSTTSGDIGEETTRNQVNETKTIKDKTGLAAAVASHH